MNAIVLRFLDGKTDDGDRVVLAEACDARTREIVAGGRVPDMADWLARHGYRWVAGSNGVWEAA